MFKEPPSPHPSGQDDYLIPDGDIQSAFSPATSYKALGSLTTLATEKDSQFNDPKTPKVPSIVFLANASVQEREK
jgi:hypothetical protein